MPFNRLAIVILTGATLVASPSFAQAPSAPRPSSPGAVGVEEATELTQAWAFLSQGLTAQASAKAAQALAARPRSAAALILAVEVEIARGGAAGGLTQYERWLGQRTLEEPSILRRIAVALLREHANAAQDPAARLEALRALASDGDNAAVALLSRGDASGSGAETRVLASLGNQKAVEALVASLASGSGNTVATIEALGDSGNKAAIAPLTARLKDPNPEVRAVAVTGLGKLGQQYDLIDRIKSALSDQTAYVRVKAARALYGLGDMSGLQMLQELSTSDAAVSRLMAAQAMASRPDAQWLDLVRGLTSASEPEVRVGAATLLAPHDPELARRVLEAAMKDQNPAIREMADTSAIEASAGDLRGLRLLLRTPRPLDQVRAAGRILALVR